MLCLTCENIKIECDCFHVCLISSLYHQLSFSVTDLLFKMLCDLFYISVITLWRLVIAVYKHGVLLVHSVGEVGLCQKIVHLSLMQVGSVLLFTEITHVVLRETVMLIDRE